MGRINDADVLFAAAERPNTVLYRQHSGGKRVGGSGVTAAAAALVGVLAAGVKLVLPD